MPMKKAKLLTLFSKIMACCSELRTKQLNRLPYMKYINIFRWKYA
jgi:hypothetical protein